MDYKSRISELEKQLKELNVSKQIEIEAKSIQIHVLQSNIESLKDQICAYSEGKKELEVKEEKDEMNGGMKSIMLQNSKLKIQVELHETAHLVFIG